MDNLGLPCSQLIELERGILKNAVQNLTPQPESLLSLLQQEGYALQARPHREEFPAFDAARIPSFDAAPPKNFSL